MGWLVLHHRSQTVHIIHNPDWRTPWAELVLVACLQATAELVYGTVQAVIFSCVLYFAAGFARDAGKFFWFLLFCW